MKIKVVFRKWGTTEVKPPMILQVKKMWINKFSYVFILKGNKRIDFSKDEVDYIEEPEIDKEIK